MNINEVGELFDNKNKVAWNTEINKSVMLYPSEHVVRFSSRINNDCSINSSPIMLDIGIGSGRNTIVFLNKGYIIDGIDYSLSAINEAKKALSVYGEQVRSLLNVNLKDYITNYKYDVILCIGTIFLNVKEVVEERLKLINDLLIEDGDLLINFRSKEDWLYKNGNKISNNTYLIKEKKYYDMVYSFFDIQEIENMLLKSGFKIVNVEKEDYYKNNLNEKHSWWIVHAKKYTYNY